MLKGLLSAVRERLFGPKPDDSEWQDYYPPWSIEIDGETVDDIAMRRLGPNGWEYRKLTDKERALN